MQEMEVGPPEPAVRGRLQTTASCDGQETRPLGIPTVADRIARRLSSDSWSR